MTTGWQICALSVLLVPLAAQASGAEASGFFLRADQGARIEHVTIPAEDEFSRDGTVAAFARPEVESPSRVMVERSFRDAEWPEEVVSFNLSRSTTVTASAERREPFWLSFRADRDFPEGALRVSLHGDFGEGLPGQETREAALLLTGGYEIFAWENTQVTVGASGEVSLHQTEEGAEESSRIGVFQEVAWQWGNAVALRGNLAGLVDPAAANLDDYAVRAQVEGEFFNALTFGVLFAHERSLDLASEWTHSENRVSTRIGYRF